MVKKESMKNILLIILFFQFFNYGIAKGDSNLDQWEDSDKSYRDLIEEGFEVKGYDTNTIDLNNGLIFLLFVTVLQKNKEIYECQEYQTIDETMTTLDMTLVCRKLIQPYTVGVGT